MVYYSYSLNRGVKTKEERERRKEEEKELYLMGYKLGKWKQVIDEKYTRPQGLYLHKDVDHKKLRKLIIESKLAPCYPGDEECTGDLEECPICFLYYPSLNTSRCCMKGICTECFLRMKVPNSTRPTQCPFCETSIYAVEYRGVKTKKEKERRKEEENELCLMCYKLGRWKQVIDEKYTRPQGLYLHKDVDLKKLRKLILESKLAPCYPGDEECTCDLEECPICFLYYPSLNTSRCCMKGICTECFLQLKVPNSTRPTQCPFCETSNYAVEYRGVKTKEEKDLEQREEQVVIEAKIGWRQH